MLRIIVVEVLFPNVQVSPEIFDRVQVRALAGPFKDIKRLVPKPLLRCLGCMLRVVVLLEGEPSPQSEVLSALEPILIKDLSVLCSVHLSLDTEQSPSLCCGKTSATTMLHRRDGARFPPAVPLGIQTKQFNLGFIRLDNLVSHGLRVL